MSDEEFAILKRLVEKRDREAVQVTVTQVDTVQHSSPCSLDPEPSPDVCVNLENNKRRMDPQSETSSNHHQLVRVSRRPDSSVPRTRGYGNKDEPSPSAS